MGRGLGFIGPGVRFHWDGDLVYLVRGLGFIGAGLGFIGTGVRFHWDGVRSHWGGGLGFIGTGVRFHWSGG